MVIDCVNCLPFMEDGIKCQNCGHHYSRLSSCKYYKCWSEKDAMLEWLKYNPGMTEKDW